VLEKVQAAAAQQAEMMTAEEVSVNVRGRSASLVGTVISDEQVFACYER